MQTRLIAWAVAAALAPAVAPARGPAPLPPPAPVAPAAPATPTAATPELSAARAELAAARRELERAASRLAELTQAEHAGAIQLALQRPAFVRPVIGIVMDAEAGEGIRLAAVTPNGPAAKAGLRAGDRLLRINGQDVRGEDIAQRLAQAHALIGTLEVGESVRLAYARAGQTREVTLVAEAMPGLVWWSSENGSPAAPHLPVFSPDDFKFEMGMLAPLAACGETGADCLMGAWSEAYRWRGLRLAALEPKLGRYFGRDHGVLVLTAPGEGLAGLEPGDVIVAVDGEQVTTPQAAMRRLREKQPGERIDVEFVRERKIRRSSLQAPPLARLPLLAPPPPTPPAPPAPPTPPAPPAKRTHPTPAAAAPAAPPAPPPPPPDERGVLEQVWH